MPITHSASLNHKPVGIRKRLSVLRRHTGLVGDRLLEIGCGNGDYAAELAKHFGHVVGVDIEPDELPAARDRGVPALQMSAARLGFPDGTFDLVLAIEVLEHVESVENVVAEVHRVLRRGGVFCFTSPNRWFPIETHSVRVFGRQIHGRRLPLLPYVPRLHRRMSEARNFKATGLRAVLCPLGFEQLAIDYVPLPFDSWRFGTDRLRALLERLDNSPLRKVTAVSVAGVFRKT